VRRKIAKSPIEENVHVKQPIQLYIHTYIHTYLHTVEDSEELLEEKVEVKQPIQQNAIGGKGVYLNTHQVKRSMTLSAFKKNAMKQENLPPMLDAGYTPDALRE
jgi:hypothetical protein